MAASTGAPVSLRSRPVNLTRILGTSRFMGQRVVSVSGFGSKQRFSGLRVFCVEAKPATVDKVCEIVKEQLALSVDSPVVGESKFSELGADSLDTVEIVMKLEEEFDITVEEDSAQTITTVQDAADLIETLRESKKA